VTGQAITINPLTNDLSPSGDELNLVGANFDTGPSEPQVVTDPQKGTVTVTASAVGEYYLKYTLGAGAKTTDGLIRVDVAQGGGDSGPIAVADDAYVRPGETTTVDPLANDSSPSGRVLAVRSVTKSDTTSDLNVELLDNQVVKVTSPTVLPQQVQLNYVVSDGVKEASSTITVVPIPPVVVHQPPVASDDEATVRVGDIATVDVLGNDYSPDNEPFTLDSKLHDTSNEGAGATAFVSGNTVRYQAPDKPGQYSVSYSISDKWGQSAIATVTFAVTGKDGKDRAPAPSLLTARTFGGSSIPITVPLSGIDPDGDSVTLDGIVSQPSLGRIAASNSDSFTYEAYPGSGGTDTFTYRVVDTYGKTATGTVRIGVVQRPSNLQPPVAVNDTVQVKPGRTASVPVLANDSDPNGFTISLEKKLSDVDSALGASVHGKIVLVRAPQKQGVYVARYTISNGQGGQDSAYVQVIVTDDAKPVYPTAVDQVVESAQAAGKKSVKVDVLAGAVNPSDLVDKLVVGVTGPNAKSATVGQNGTVTVTPGHTRMAVAYTLTDPTTGLAGEAFIVVPPASDGTAPPRVKVPQQIVSMNGTKTWKLSDIIAVPSGRPAKITGASGVTATHSSRSGYIDGQTLTFTADKDYRGPASITFKVDDGREPGEAKDRVTSLVLPITVGNPDQSDVPPTFTPPNVTIQAGESAINVDLRASTYHPNPQILSKITYSDFSGAAGGVVATPNGSTLALSAPFGVQPGTTATIRFKVNSATTSIPGSVNVKVVSSTRPIAQQKNPPIVRDIKRGSSTTVSDAASDDTWVNPFPGHALTIASAKQVSGPKGATVTFTASSITVSAATGADIGVVNVQYTVQDATKDPARTKATIGQLQVNIHDVPARPDAPTAVANGDGSIKVTLSRAPADNGKTIDHYVIYANGTSVKTVNDLGTYAISVTDGTAYTFTAVAHNADGNSTASAKSNSVTTYGTPAAPDKPSISENGDSPSGKVSFSWSALSDAATKGGLKTYEWKFSNGATGQTTGLNGSVGGLSAGNYSVKVRAENQGGIWGAWSASSATVNVPAPQPSVTLKKGNYYNGSGCSYGCYYYVTTIANFPSGSHTVDYYCDGDKQTWTDTINGTSGTINSENERSLFRCGYDNAWVTVDGHKSNVMDFHP
jgi:hypothetical protein